MDSNKLNNEWTLWFHSPIEPNWGIDSYKNIYSIKTIEEFWEVYNKLKSIYVENAMFFLMKGDIPPLWESSENIDGGCWSFKIYKKSVFDTWLDLSINMLCETLTTNIGDSDIINGLSISPKKTFSIIKIWNNDSSKNDNNLINNSIKNINLDESLYKSHKGR